MATLLMLGAFFGLCWLAILFGGIALYFIIKYLFDIIGAILIYSIIVSPFHENESVLTSQVYTNLRYYHDADKKEMVVIGDFTNTSKRKIVKVYVKCSVQVNAYGESKNFNRYVYVKGNEFTTTFQKMDILLNSYYTSPNMYCHVEDYSD